MENEYVEATYLTRYTHSPSTVRAIFTEPISARIRKYNRACLDTFTYIPDFVISNKNKVPRDAPFLFQVTSRMYVYTYNAKSARFIEKVIDTYREFIRTKTLRRRQQILHAYPLSTILRDIQKLRDAQSAEYHYLKTLIPSSHLKLLIEMKVLSKVRLDYIFNRNTILVFLHKNFRI